MSTLNGKKLKILKPAVTLEVDETAKTKGHHKEGIWNILEYSVRENTDTWTSTKAENRNMFLILKNHCLMLTYKETLMECISLLTNKANALYKNDQIIVTVHQENMKIRHIKIRFAGLGLRSGCKICSHFAETLKGYINTKNALVNDDESESSDSCTTSLPKYISELLTKNLSDFYADNEYLSTAYPLEDLIDACILDTNFPSIVVQVNKIMKKAGSSN